MVCLECDELCADGIGTHTKMTALNGLTVWSRLLGAFVGISMLAILGGAVALYVFHEVATVLDEVIEQRMPSALAALELSRQAERIAAAAPSLLAARVQSDRTAIAEFIFGEVYRMETLLADLKVPTAAAGSLKEVELAVAGLHRNLESLDAVVSHRIVVGEHKQALLDRLAAVSVTGERVAQPASLVLGSQVSALRRAANGELQSSNAPTILELAEGIATNMAMQHAHGELTALNEALLRASDASSADLRLQIYSLQRSLAALDKDVGSVDFRQRARLQQVVDEFRHLTEGADSIPEARTAELTLVADGERLLAENLALSKGLTGAVDKLVAAARDEISRRGQ